MGAQPNYYSASLNLGNATTCNDGAPTFVDRNSGQKFEASFVRLRSLETAIDIYVNYYGGVATTMDSIVRACSDTGFFRVPPMSGLTAYTTSTTAANKVLNVTVMGG